MNHLRRGQTLAAHVLTLLIVLAMAYLAFPTARAQEPRSEPRVLAEKIDEYGSIRHCDMSARLDNLAVELQNEPGARAFIIAFDPQVKKYDFAGWNLKVARHYLVHVRGIEAGRIVTIHGGNREAQAGIVELWTVPESAAPPVAPPTADKYADKNFSGKFDYYSTDEQIYMYVVEMGYLSEDISRAEFAEKLKQQPESVGYLVVRAAKDSAPGAWSRVGRRDEQILQRDYGIEAHRLKSIEGGWAEGDHTQVELWILPKADPPPVAVTEKGGKKPDAAFRLNTFDINGMAEVDENAERWMIENLVEMLRENPRASAYLVAREPEEPETTEGEDVAASVSEAVEEPAVEGEEQAGNVPIESAGEEESEIENTMKGLAEKWKRVLVKSGVESHRVVVLEGRRIQSYTGRLATWIVPENSTPPDAFARDKDEPEDEESQAQETGESSQTPTAPPPQGLELND